MKDVTRVRVAAPPERLWPWVAHPDGIMRWNEKLVEHDAPPLADLAEDRESRLTYRMRFLMRFGTPVEGTHLETLRGLVEAGEAV